MRVIIDGYRVFVVDDEKVWGINVGNGYTTL